MITRGCFLLVILANSGLSHPVLSDVAGNKDLKVMNCIVELIANTLSKPQPQPRAVSQKCLDVLMQDEMIASILRHQNLLRELQEVAAQGSSERTHQPLNTDPDGGVSQVTDAPRGHLDVWPTADRSMLLGLGQTASDEKSHEEGGASEQEVERQQWKAESEENNMIERNTNVHEDKGGNLEEDSEDEVAEKRGKMGDANKSPNAGGNDESAERNSAQVNKVMDSDERLAAKMRRAEREGVITEKERKMSETEEDLQNRSKEEGESREDEEEAEEDEARQESSITEASVPRDGREGHGIPETRQRHLVAGEETEEGSASQKTEDNEIERLAAIESELGSLAQRLHQLQRG